MMLTSSDCECTKSELMVFEPRPLQTVMERGQWVNIHPLNNVSQGNTPIEFKINGSSDEYLDLNDTMLHLTCKLVKNNGQNFTADDANQPAPVNNFLHSLFSDVKLMIGEKQLEGGVHLYPYRALLSNLLAYSNSTKNTQLFTSGFVKDTAGQFNNVENNIGHEKRRQYVVNSKTFDLCGPLWLDMMAQSRYLINQIDVDITLVRSKPDFYLFNGDGGIGGRIIIEDAVLYVRRVKIEPGTLMEVEKRLLNENAIYPIQRTEMLVYSIPAGSMNNSKEGLFLGHMPKLLIFGMVDNIAYNGNLHSNPFNFQHNEVTNIALYKDGISIPYRPLTPDFTNGLCTREYISLYQNLQLFNRDCNFGITLQQYTAGGYTLFAFNLTPDLALAEHAQLYEKGSLRLELKFTSPRPSTINVIVMAVFDAKVEITRQRQVLVDYKN